MDEVSVFVDLDLVARVVAVLVEALDAALHSVEVELAVVEGVEDERWQHAGGGGNCLGLRLLQSLGGDVLLAALRRLSCDDGPACGADALSWSERELRGS